MPSNAPGGIVGQLAPSTKWLAVTPDDDTDLSAGPCRAIYVGTPGDLDLVSAQGDAVVFVGVQAGSVLPLQARRVKASSTTASNIVALY